MNSHAAKYKVTLPLAVDFDEGSVPLWVTRSFPRTEPAASFTPDVPHYLYIPGRWSWTLAGKPPNILESGNKAV